jgi:N-terminal half of MaoC dehydratase
MGSAGRLVGGNVGRVKTHITDEMRAIVGVVMDEQTSYPISASDIRRWALAVYYPEIPPPEFWDEEDPITVAMGGIVAPDEFNPLAWLAKDPKPRRRPDSGPAAKTGAFEARLGVEPPQFRALLQGEIRARYGEPQMRPGDVIRAETSITEYFEREGRRGLQLYTTLSEELTNQHGAWVKTVDTVFVRY